MMRLALSLTFLAACSSSAVSTDASVSSDLSTTDVVSTDTVSTDTVSTDTVSTDTGYTPSARVAARPYMHRLPSTYDPATPIPLVVLLHGYGASGSVQAAYLTLLAAVPVENFALAYPDGTLDSSGRRFWNATDACCNFERAEVDDVAYVDAVIDDMKAQYNIDPRRVFLIGHSNGGFMAHRYACERAGRIAGVVSLAGAGWSAASRCTPERPVSVLQVHGTNDATIRYTGGGAVLAGAGGYPSARASVEQWVTHNRCGALAMTSETLDIERALAGAETRVERAAGCMGGGAELWTIQGGSHIPSFGPEWSRALGRWMAAHPAP